jgi:hypothetical protein
MLLGSLVHAYGASGNRAEAEKEFKKLVGAAKTKFGSPYFLATAYAGLGDKDELRRCSRRTTGSQFAA